MTKKTPSHTQSGHCSQSGKGIARGKKDAPIASPLVAWNARREMRRNQSVGTLNQSMLHDRMIRRVEASCSLTTDLQKARHWFAQSRPIQGKRSEEFLQKFGVDTADLMLGHLDNFPSQCGYRVGPALTAPIWHDGQFVGMHTTLIGDCLEIWSYEQTGIHGIGTVTVRIGDPRKIVIAEQIQDALMVARQYDDEFTVLSACSAYGLAAYNPPRVDGVEIVIATVSGDIAQASAAALFTKVASLGGRNKARIVDVLEAK